MTIKLPKIPDEYFCSFLRGYFDGDGCIHVYYKGRLKTPIVQVIYTSGSASILKSISRRLSMFLNIKYKTNMKSWNGAYQLRYKKKDSIAIIKFMYQHADETPILHRKYEMARKFFI